MKKFERVFLIVLDSLGVGSLPDARDYNDEACHTLNSILKSKENVVIPNLQKLGFGNFSTLTKYHSQNPMAYLTKLKEASLGKDTMTGHWEMMGLKITEPFVTFTETGFPKELIDELEARTGRKVVGNKSSSGTEILDELGEHQLATGDLIVYTSADSVLQIAAHEQVISIEELYRYCEIAREITMKPEWLLGRIIARPYLGNKKGEFKRTSNRHDYALKPFGKTVLNSLKDAGLDVISVGKINDIFDTEGITDKYKSNNNHHGMEHTINKASDKFTGLCFTNLVDFDANYGHRRDAFGYATCLEEFDVQLGELLEKLTENDLLLITADHGNDPCHYGSDHTREYIPLVAYSKVFERVETLSERETFADIGATIAANFEVVQAENGNPIEELLK